MFRIKRITGSFLPSNKKYISQIKKILKEQFPLIRKKELNKLPDLLKNPLKYKFKTFVYVSDDYNRNIKSFAVMMYAPDINFCYLDYISAAKNQTGGGQGYALYKFIRNEAAELKAIGIFFECLPDDPKLCKDEKILKQNKSRLKFYERFGARPVINTLYETPLKPDDDNPPYLVFDNLNKNFKLKKEKLNL